MRNVKGGLHNPLNLISNRTQDIERRELDESSRGFVAGFIEAALHHAADHLKMKFLTDFVKNFMEELRIPLNLMSNRTP